MKQVIFKYFMHVRQRFSLPNFQFIFFEKGGFITAGDGVKAFHYEVNIFNTIDGAKFDKASYGLQLPLSFTNKHINNKV